MIENIILYVIAAAPALVSIISIVAAAIKLIKFIKTIISELITVVNSLKQEVLNTKEYQSIKEELKTAHQENIELKKLLNECLTELTKVKRGDKDGKSKQN